MPAPTSSHIHRPDRPKRMPPEIPKYHRHQVMEDQTELIPSVPLSEDYLLQNHAASFLRCLC